MVRQFGPDGCEQATERTFYLFFFWWGKQTGGGESKVYSLFTKMRFFFFDGRGGRLGIVAPTAEEAAARGKRRYWYFDERDEGAIRR